MVMIMSMIYHANCVFRRGTTVLVSVQDTGGIIGGKSDPARETGISSLRLDVEGWAVRTWSSESLVNVIMGLWVVG